MSFLRISGGEGPALDLDDQDLNLFDFRIDNLTGQAIRGGGSWRLGQGDVSSNHADGSPLIEHTGADLQLEQVALHGNVVEGAPLLESSGRLSMVASYLGANVVLGDQPLLEARVGEARAGDAAGLWTTVVERNRLVSTGEATPASLPDVQVVPEGGPFCLPQGADGRPFRARPVPAIASPGAPSDAPLVRLEATNSADRGLFTVSQTFVLDNEQGEGEPLFALGPGPATQLNLLHSHVESEASPQMAESAGSPLTVVSGRNVYLDAFTPMVEPPTHGEASHDVLGPGVVHPLSQVFGGGPWIGPIARLKDPGSAFVGSDGPDELSACQRLRALCPSMADDCDALEAGDQPNQCALGDAVERLPADGFADAVALPWTWTGTWGESPGDRFTPGPADGECLVGDAPLDRHLDDFGTVGDGDGFSQMLDCDNEDETVLPALPDRADIVDGPCVAKDGVCFVCPEGTEPEPEPTPTPAPPVDGDNGSSCDASGCGISWAGLWLAPLVGAGSRRRP